jgi:tRNA threonylcarbamoyladenosine biosynthesis protein TsaE
MTGPVGLAALAAAGEALGRRLQAGAVVYLQGELGAGKTTMVQAIARGLGVVTHPTSPSYALVHRYAGPRGPVFHVDCYRLRSADEARDIDWTDMAAEGAAILVEWPDRAGAWAPAPDVLISLDYGPDPDTRRMEIRDVAGA